MFNSMPDWLALPSGLVVGISLGLTGGGGSIFAVPLLIYLLHVPVRTAVAMSLAAVGLTAGFGAALQIRAREIDWRPGLIFAFAGMIFTPAGTWLGHFIPMTVLLSIFGLIMGLVALRMWQGRAETSNETGPCVALGNGALGFGCYTRLTAAGATAGILSGLFGIGGGFIIVPSLIYVTGTSIHRAVATSLLVIFLISISGVIANLYAGQFFPMPLTPLFLTGGFMGMLIGTTLRSHLDAKILRRIFAIAMLLVGAFMLYKNGVALLK
jgi:uncharacterized membrane protein YfcA